MNSPNYKQEAKASTTKTTFSRETTVSILINADAPTVWALLTNARDFPRWNSTIVSLGGTIEEGEKIKLKSTLDERRTFVLRVKELTPNQRMVWSSAQGNRTYTLTETGNGTNFTMTEKIASPFFPLFAKFIPPFDENFEQFARDLQTEATGSKNAHRK